MFSSSPTRQRVPSGRWLRLPAIGVLLALVAFSNSGCEAIKTLTQPGSVNERMMALTASSTALPEGGGDVALTATVTMGGEPESGVTVRFETSAGEFVPSKSVVTDSQGNARTTLRTTERATISAKVGSGSIVLASSSELVVQVGDAVLSTADMTFTLSLTPNPAPLHEPVRLQISVARKDTGNPVAGKLKVEFGDGKQTKVNDFSGKAKVEHTYKQESLFQVVATMTDKSGVTGAATFELRVTDQAPMTISITADAEETPARESLGFEVRIGREGGRNASGNVTIDWGDGRRTTLGTVSGAVSVEHSYREPGSYKVVAEVEGGTGKPAKSSIRVQVQERLQLSATLSVDDPTPAVDQTISYTVTARRSDGKAASGTVVVVFDDNTTTTVSVTGSTAGFQHAFAVAGSYTTSVVFDDGVGHTADANVRVDVSDDDDSDENDNGGGSNDDIDANSLQWLHDDAADWKVSSTVNSISVSSAQICISHTKAGQWPVQDNLEGNPWVVAQVNGIWYAGTYEWLRPGQICKALGVPGDYPNIASAIGPHVKVSPLEGWVPKSGETVYFFVSTFARAGVRSSDERSNIVKVIWP